LRRAAGSAENLNTLWLTRRRKGAKIPAAMLNAAVEPAAVSMAAVDLAGFPRAVRRIGDLEALKMRAVGSLRGKPWK
jgi:hypothetical protein